MRNKLLTALSTIGLVAGIATAQAAERPWPVPTRGTITQDNVSVGECSSHWEWQKWKDGKLHRVWHQDDCTAHAHNTFNFSFPVDDMPYLRDTMRAWENRKPFP